MRRLMTFLMVSLTGSLAYAANGVQAGVTVSSGSYQNISTYGNADGANRQAIVIGDFTSSDTVRVDSITGMRVSLSTSALTTSGAVLVVSTGTQTVSGSVSVSNFPATYTVTPGTGTMPVSGTFFQTTQPVSWATAQPVTSTSTVITTTAAINITHGGVGQPVTQSGTWTVQPGNTQNTTSWLTSSTSTVITTTASINTTVTNSPAVTQSGTWTVQPGNTQNTTPWLTTSTSSVITAVVSSITLPSPLTDATTSSVLIDSSRRLITADIPFELMTTVTNTSAAPNTTEVVLISSATAPKRTLLCGCIFMNSSATNTGFTLYQSTSSVAANLFYPIGVPANYQPSGLRPDCGHPFFASTVGGAITIKPAATASTVTMNCTYLQK